MKPVKTQPKYKCDFCKKRGIKRVMNFHEPMCYRNPNRVCSFCQNTGKVEVAYGDEHDTRGIEDCSACSKFDKEKLKEIEEYEKSFEVVKTNSLGEDLPF